MRKFSFLIPILLLVSGKTLYSQCPPPGFPEPGNTCPLAPILCENLDGYCATINNFNNPNQFFPGCGPPWQLNNDEWFAFFAGTTSITIQVTPINCTQGGMMGLQGGIYYGCGGPVMDVQCECTQNPFILTSNNFIVGAVYWMVLDGCNGNVCDYTIDVLSGSTVGVPPANPGPVTGNLNPCQGATVPYSLPPVPGATIYNWTLTPASAGSISGTTNNINITWSNPGTAQICVSTANLCYSNPTTSCLTVNVVPTPTATLSGNGVLCAQGNTDPVELTVAFTGTAPWTFGYSIAGVPQAPITTSNNPYTLVVITPGAVVLTSVTSTTGNCPGTVSGNVTIPLTTITAQAQGDNPECFGSSDGSITINISGGTTPYTFNWSNGSSDQNPTGLPAGTYNVTITDANGCTQTASASLTNPPQLTATAVGTNPLCNGGYTGSIDLTVGGGTTPYSYLWSNNATTQDVSGLAAGTYTVTVNDANDCEQIVSVTLTNPPQLTASATGTDPLCFGNSNGSIDLTTGGGTPPYTYSWSNGSNVQDPAGLPAGTYTVTVTDANGCQQTTSVTLGQPPQLTASGAGTNPVCFGGNNGSIDLTVGGGTAPYTYTWSNGSNVQDPTGLGAGTYTVTVTDSHGCQQTATVSLTNPLQIVATTQGANPLCNGGSTGSINLTVSNGTAPYSYNWSNGSNVQDPTGLSAGTYSVTITDANGCTQTASATLTNPPLLVASVTAVQQVDCTHPTGSITTSVSGGTPGYTYQWSPLGSGANPVGLPAGTYTGTITDANGCTTTVTATVNSNLTPPTAAASVTGILTCSVTSLTLSGAGSSTGGNYTYLWTGPGIVSGGNTLNPIVNQPGTYTLTVTNTTNGCTQIATVTVPQDVTPPIATGTAPAITCNNPTVTINGAGSSTGPNFTYLWTGPGIVSGNTTLNPVVNQPGNYTLAVTNTTNGCVATTVVNVANQTQLPVAMGSAPPLTCSNPAVTISGAGSSTGPNFTYLWTGPGIVSGANTLNPIVNQPGVYTLTVTNTATGCVNSTTVNVTQNITPPTAEAGPTAQLDCGDPTIQLNGAGSSAGPGFTYQWAGPGVIGGGNTLTPTVNQPGLYTLTVTNTANGCTASDQVNVTANFQPPFATAAQPPQITCAVTQVQLNGTGSSTGPNITYNWTTQGGIIISGANTLTPIAGAGGLYILTVTNSDNQCTASYQVVVQTNLTPPVAIAGPVAELTCAINQVQLIGAGSSQGPNFTYTWSTTNGNIVSGGNTLYPIVNAPGTYTLTVTNTVNGCTSSSNTSVVVDEDVPIANAGPPQLLTCVIPQVALNGTQSSSGPLFAYQWSTTNGNIVSGANTTTPIVNLPGQYQLTVTSLANGCQSSSFVTVTQDIVLPAVIIAPAGEVNCYTPEITIDATGSSSQGDLSFTWNTADGNIVSGQGTLLIVVDAGGTYVLTIQNNETGCLNGGGVTVPENVDDPVLMIAPPGIVSCATPQLELNTTGSSTGPEFVYSWTTVDGNIVSGADTPSPLISSGGTYELTILNTANNCSTIGQVVVPENADLPTIELATPQELNCTVVQTQLNATIGNGFNLTYVWSSIDGNFVSGENTLQPVVDAPGTYQIEVTNPATGCQGLDQVEVFQDIQYPVSDAGPDGVLTCTVTSLQLDGTASGSGPGLTYLWSNIGGNIVSGDDTPTPVVDEPGSYVLAVINTSNTCETTDTAIITQDIAIPAAVAADPVLMGCLNPVITLDGTASTSGAQIVYEWSTQDGHIVSGAGTPQPDVDAPGDYTLTVLDTVNGCFSSTTITVVQDIQLPGVDAGPGAELTCFLTEYTLQGSISGQTDRFEFAWTTLDGNIISGEQTLTPLAGEAGTYTLTAVDTINGCAASASVVITQDANVPIADVIPSNPMNCYFPTVTLDATGSTQGPSIVYAWSTPDGNFVGGTETLVTVIDMPGTYILTISDTLNACVTSQTLLIPADTAAPVLTIAPPDQLTCYQPETSLSATVNGLSDITLAWSTTGGNITGNENTLSPTIDQPGLYTLQVTDNLNGCSSTIQTLVDSDFAIPAVDAGPGGTINCAVTTLVLSGSGDGGGAPLSWSWTTADGNLVSGQDTPNPLIDAGGTYQLTVVNLQNGCLDSTSVFIPVDLASPVADAGPQGFLNCYGPPIQLDGAGSTIGPEFTYSWTTNDGNILSGANTLAPAIDLPGLYQIQVLNLENGCSSIDSVQVGLDTLAPLALAATPGLITCAVTTLLLDGAGSSTGPGFSYSWSTLDGNIISGEHTLSPVVNTTGLYTLTVLNTFNGCIATASTIVLEDTDPPTGDAGAAPDLTCAVTSVTLAGTVSGPGTGLVFSWSTNDGNIVSGGNTLNPVVDEPGTYTFTMLNPENGCSSSDPVVVGQNTTPPVVVVAGPGVLTCIQEQVTLNAAGSSTGSDFSLAWTTVGGNILSGGQTVNPIVDQPGTYTLTITNGINGCASTETVQVTQDIDPPLVDAGVDFTMPCIEPVTFLQGSVDAPTTNLSINWSTPDGQIESGASTLSPGVLSGGSYLLTVVNLVNGCSNADQVVVVQDLPADPDFEPVQPLCFGDKGQIEILGVAGGTPPYVYSVNGGSTFQAGTLFYSLAPGLYSIVVQDALGCETVPENQQILEPDPVLVDVGAAVELLQGDSYQLHAQVNLAESDIELIAWTPPTGLSCWDCLDPVVTPLQTTLYTVVITDLNGCLGTALVQFFVDERPLIYVPNIFSPNGDGENDWFYIFAREGNIAEIRSFLVFDRWGETVFEYHHFQPNDPAFGWDGAFRGQAVDPAVFTWFAEVEMIDGRVELFKGGVTLIR